MWSLLLLAAPLSAAPLDEERVFRMCGQEPGRLEVRVGSASLGELLGELRVHPDVELQAQVRLVSTLPIAPEVEVALARAAARSLGLRVSGRAERTRVRPAKGPVPGGIPTLLVVPVSALSSEQAVARSGGELVEQTEQHGVLAWSPDAALSGPLSLLARAGGASVGTDAPDATLPEGLRMGEFLSPQSEEEPQPLGELGAAAGSDLSSMVMFLGGDEALCDALASAAAVPTLWESGVELDLNIAGLGAVSTADASDLLAALAPRLGAEWVADEHLQLLHRVAPAPDKAPSLMAMVLPQGTELFGMSADSLASQSESLARLSGAQVVQTRAGSAAMVMDLDASMPAGLGALGLGSSTGEGVGLELSEEQRQARREEREARALERRARLDERVARRRASSSDPDLDEGITREGDTLRFDRSTVISLRVRGLGGLEPVRDEAGELAGYELVGYSGPLRRLGVVSGMRLVAWDDGPFDEDEDLRALAEALLTRDRVEVQLAAADGERQTLVWEISGEPATITDELPEPRLRLDLAEARTRAGIEVLEGHTLRVPREALMHHLGQGLGGAFTRLSVGAAVGWQPDRGAPEGLSLLLGVRRTRRVVVDGREITDEQGVRALLDGLASAEQLELDVGAIEAPMTTRVILVGEALAGGWPGEVPGVQVVPDFMAGPEGTITAAEACVLRDLEPTMRLMRIIPHRGAGGELDGFRASAIRRGSVFQRIGVKNGDVLQAIDGAPVVQSTALFAALGPALSVAGTHRLSVLRRGQPAEVVYEVEGGGDCPDAPGG